MAPRDIPPGTDWPTAVMHAIKGAKTLVLLLSAASHSDKQIAREVENADHEGLSIITVRLDNVSPPDQLAYFLRNLQWLDAFDGRFDSAVERLANVVIAPEAPRTPTLPGLPNAERVKPPEPASNNRTMMLAGTAVAIVVIAFGAWALLHKKASAPTPQPDSAKTATTQNPSTQATAAQTANAQVALEGQVNADVENSVPPASGLDQAQLIQLRKAARREWRNGKPEKAITDISHVITLDPHWAAPYLDRGEWELARGQDNEALTDFKTCIDAHPNSLAIEQIAYQHRGELEQSMGDGGSAKADLAEAAAIKSKMGNAKSR